MITDDIGDIIFMNLLLMIFWHLIVLILSMSLNPAFFNPKRGINAKRNDKIHAPHHMIPFSAACFKNKLFNVLLVYFSFKRTLRKAIFRNKLREFIFPFFNFKNIRVKMTILFPFSFLVNSSFRVEKSRI